MDDNVEAYPLSWPPGVPRTPASARRRASFGSVQQGFGKAAMTIARGRDRLLDELTKAGARGVIISTNLKLRKDGLPWGEQKEPEDPGVAVYFELEKQRRCIPGDRWDRVADNLAGVAAAVGALRGLERWVNDANVRAAFRGFLALPDPNRVDWRAMFGLKNGFKGDAREHVLRRYRELAEQRHPDKPGGSTGAMAELNMARDQALAELGVRP